jgi:hypothetical protein
VFAQKRCEGNLLRKWQPRYCILSSKGLMYFKSKEDHAAKKEPTFIPTEAFRNCSASGLEILLETQVRALSMSDTKGKNVHMSTCVRLRTDVARGAL